MPKVWAWVICNVDNPYTATDDDRFWPIHGKTTAGAYTYSPVLYRTQGRATEELAKAVAKIRFDYAVARVTPGSYEYEGAKGAASYLDEFGTPNLDEEVAEVLEELEGEDGVAMTKDGWGQVFSLQLEEE